QGAFRTSLSGGSVAKWYRPAAGLAVAAERRPAVVAERRPAVVAERRPATAGGRERGSVPDGPQVLAGLADAVDRVAAVGVVLLDEEVLGAGLLGGGQQVGPVHVALAHLGELGEVRESRHELGVPDLVALVEDLLGERGDAEVLDVDELAGARVGLEHVQRCHAAALDP